MTTAAARCESAAQSLDSADGEVRRLRKDRPPWFAISAFWEAIRARFADLLQKGVAGFERYRVFATMNV